MQHKLVPCGVKFWLLHNPFPWEFNTRMLKYYNRHYKCALSMFLAMTCGDNRVANDHSQLSLSTLRVWHIFNMSHVWRDHFRRGVYIFFSVIGNIWGDCTFHKTQFFQTTHGQEQQQPCRDIWPCWLNEFKILPKFHVVILGLCVVVVSDSLRSTLRLKFKLSMQRVPRTGFSCENLIIANCEFF